MAKDKSIRLRLKAVDRMSRSIDRVKKKFPGLSRSIRRASRAATIFNAQTATMRRNMKKLGGSMKRIGQTMMLGLTLPIAAAGVAGAKLFADFESGLRGVEKTTGLARAEVAQLGERFAKLSTTIPVSTAEMLELAKAGGQLGIKGVDNIEKFTVTLSKLARASDVAGEEGAKSIARILTVTGDGISKVDRFSAALVDLGNNAAAGEQEILEVATRVAGQIGRFDVASESVLGISTALKALGKRSEAAGSVIGRGFDAIDQAIKKGGKEMMLLSKLSGVAVKDLKQAFEKDASDVFQKFVEGLGKVQKGGGNMVAVMGAMGLSGVRINDVLGTLAKRPEVLAENLDRATKAFAANTALQKEFEIQTDSFGSEIAEIVNTFKDLGRLIGAELAPAIKFIGNILKGIANFLRENPMFRTLAIWLGLVLAVTGPLLLAMGAFLTILPALMTGAAALGVALLPLTLKFLAIGAVIGVAVAAVALLLKNWDKLIAYFDSNPFLSAIKSAFLFLNPLGKIVSAVKLMVSAFEGLDAFKNTLRDMLPKSVGDSFFGDKSLGPKSPKLEGAKKVLQDGGRKDSLSGAIDVNFRNAPAGTSARSRSDGPLNLNLGLSGGPQ